MRLFLLAMAAVGCAMLQSCGMGKNAPLRVGINPWPGFEFVALPDRLGLYEHEGVEVQVIEFSSLPDARRAFERGQLDGLGANFVEVLVSRDAPGRSMQIVQAIDYSEGRMRSSPVRD